MAASVPKIMDISDKASQEIGENLKDPYQDDLKIQILISKVQNEKMQARSNNIT
jgi:hypothetical protein